MGRLIDVIASLTSIGAGIYLVSKQSAPIDLGALGGGSDSGQSWLEVIAHGMGAYFIAKGLWMARSLHLAAEQVEAQARLVERVDVAPAAQPAPEA